MVDRKYDTRNTYDTRSTSNNRPYYDAGSPKPIPPVGSNAPPYLQGAIEEERRRRDHWHHLFGFDGERASEAERAEEARRREAFNNWVNSRAAGVQRA